MGRISNYRSFLIGSPEYLPIFFLLSVTTVSGGGLVTYEGSHFPENEKWNRENRLFLADRSLKEGWLVQHAEVVPQEPPFLDADEDDIYRRSLAEFADLDAFFLEWRMETDGPREGFPNVSPAAIVLGGTSQALYHFTIARDRIRFIDGDLNVSFFDITAGMPHTYRLELNGLNAYRFLIDGQQVFASEAIGAYPNPDSEIVFGARAAGQPITARWDYIRYGSIPEPTTLILIFGGIGVLLCRRHTTPS